MKGKKNKLNNKKTRNETIDEKSTRDEEAEINVSNSSMKDEDFLLEIKEYAKNENEGSTTSEDNELEIGNLH